MLGYQTRERLTAGAQDGHHLARLYATGHVVEHDFVVVEFIRGRAPSRDAPAENASVRCWHGVGDVSPPNANASKSVRPATKPAPPCTPLHHPPKQEEEQGNSDKTAHDRQSGNHATAEGRSM